MNTPKYARNTIMEYSIKPTKIYGDFKGNARYDLLSVITICLGNRDCENDLLGMLSALLSSELTPEQKEAVLQKYGIATTQLREEMSTMCNLSDLIEEKGIEKGREQGKEQGIEYTLEVIASLNAGKTCKEIANSLEIPLEDVERIKNRYEQIELSKKY